MKMECMHPMFTENEELRRREEILDLLGMRV
jgi:hypothetical protein